MTMTFKQYVRQKFECETRYEREGHWFYTWCLDCKDSERCDDLGAVEDFQNNHSCERDEEGFEDE